MRKLVWFAIGFTAACALGIYLSYGLWLLIAALFGVPAAVMLGLGKTKLRKQTAAVLWGCAICFSWLFAYDGLYLSHARAMDAKTENLHIEIVDYSYDLGYGTVTEGKIKLENRTYRVCVYLDGADTLTPGDMVEGDFRLRYTASGGEQKETDHQGKGIFLLCYSEENVEITEGSPGRLQSPGVRLRNRIVSLVDEIFPEDVIGFARALLLGDSDRLTYEEDKAFQISGLRHVIAVSGLHVSILFALVYMLAGKHRKMTAIIGIPVLVLFAAIAGFTPSITRACIMQILMILAMLLNREYDPPTALSFAVVAMLSVNPQTITSVSFQLSASCMVGIFLFAQRISNYLLHEKRFGPAKGKSIRARITRWICGSLSVTLSAMVTTTPLCAWYFGCVSLVGIFSNLLTLWLVSFIFYGIMLACIAGGIWLPAGKAIGWCVGWPIRFVLFVAKTLSKFPFAAVYVSDAYVVAWLIFCYVLLGVFLFSKNKRPLLFCSCILLTLVASITASRLETGTGRYRVTALDVGQGQCVLLQTKDRSYLVDCGGDTPEHAADVASDYLLSVGITRLDGIIATHYDVDHTGGIPLLLTRVSADNLYLPNVQDDGTTRQLLTECASVEISWIEPEQIYPVADGLLTIFSAKANKSDNESSLCVLFQPEDCDILITGDRTVAGERALMAQTELPDIEILIAGHHGAPTSVGVELLRATDPEIVLISVGEKNTFGHPSPETLKRLENFGCIVCRTDLDGTITIGE